MEETTLLPIEGDAPGSDPYLTAEYIAARAVEMQTNFSEEDIKIRRIRELRQMTRDVPMPEGKTFVDIQVRSPDLADEGERVVSALTLNGVALRYTPAKMGVQKYMQNADLREDVFEALLHYCGTRHPGEETLHAMVDATVNDGAGWSKVIYAPDLWEARDGIPPSDFQDDPGYPNGDGARSALMKWDEATEDAKKAAGPPFYWIPVDVASIYPTYAGMRLSEVHEITERPFYETLRAFDLGWDSNNKKLVSNFVGEPVSQTEKVAKPPKNLEVIEWWTTKKFGYVIKGGRNSVMVGPFDHDCQRPPYFCAFGYQMNWWRGKKTGMGIGETKAWLVEYKNFLRTLHANAVARDTFAPLQRTRPAGGKVPLDKDGNPVTSTEIELSLVYEGLPDEEIKGVEFPNVAKSLQDEIVLVEKDIERLMTPRVNSEIGGGGMEGAGFAISQVIAEAKIKDAPLARHIETCVEEIVRFMEYMIRDVVKERVWVQSFSPLAGDGFLSIAPADLEIPVGIKATLDPERPSAKLIEARYWAERINNGTADIDQAIEAMGDNPERVRLLRNLTRMRNSQWFMMFNDQEVTQELGAGDIIARAREAAMLAASGGIPPVGSAPGGPPESRGQPPAPQAMGNQIVPDMGQLATGTSRGGMQPGPPSGAPQVREQSAAPGMRPRGR